MILYILVKLTFTYRYPSFVSIPNPSELENQRVLFGSSVDDVQAHQIEQTVIYNFYQSLKQTIESISLILLFLDHNLPSLLRKIPALKKDVLELSLESILSTPAAKAICKNLITEIIQKQMDAVGDITTVSEMVGRQCPSFCTKEDLLYFRAMETIKKAKAVGNEYLIREALALFEQILGGIDYTKIETIFGVFEEMGYLKEAVDIVFKFAKAKDTGKYGETAYLQETTVRSCSVVLLAKLIA